VTALLHRHESHRVLFGAFVAVGATLGLVLGIVEVRAKPDVRLGDERVRLDGLVATVQVTARNTTDDETFCPVVRVAARDRDGLDLDDVEARPDFGDGRLTPGTSANFVAVLDGISSQDFDEQLDEFFAYVDDDRPC
jgi:hypothetical protein